MDSVTSLPSNTAPTRCSSQPNAWLRRYAKLLCALVLGLILKGALVTSHDAGLAVPDWPTSFGENMFLFHPSKWRGIIFFEHVHRLYASAVGFLTVILALWIWKVEPRRWVRNLSYLAVAAVVAQGVLGGLTVLFLLPVAVSSAHAVLGQSFFIITLILAYSQSKELRMRAAQGDSPRDSSLRKIGMALVAVLLLQLTVGAVMRHSSAGLAVLDFPTMGGELLPRFDAAMLDRVNADRVAIGLPPASEAQVATHLAHRAGAVVVAVLGISVLLRSLAAYRRGDISPGARRAAIEIAVLIAVQATLGVYTVLLHRQPWIASFHVMIGAALMGLSVLLVLRLWPLQKACKEACV